MKLSAALSSMLTPAIRAAKDFLLASTAREKEEVKTVLSWGADGATAVSIEPTSVVGVREGPAPSLGRLAMGLASAPGAPRKGFIRQWYARGGC